MYSANGRAKSTLRLLKSTEGGRSPNISKDAIYSSETEHGRVWKDRVTVYMFKSGYVGSEIKSIFDAIISEESTVNFGTPIELSGNVFAEETPAYMLGDTDMDLFSKYLGEPQVKRPKFESHNNMKPRIIVDSKQLAGIKVTNHSTEIQYNIYEGFIKKPNITVADDALALEIEISGGVQEVINLRKSLGGTLIQKQRYDAPWYWKYTDVMSLTSGPGPNIIE